MTTEGVDYIAGQVGVADPSAAKEYLWREKTRFEHRWDNAREHGYTDLAGAERELVRRIDGRAWTTGTNEGNLRRGGGVAARASYPGYEDIGHRHGARGRHLASGGRVRWLIIRRNRGRAETHEHRDKQDLTSPASPGPAIASATPGATRTPTRIPAVPGPDERALPSVIRQRVTETGPRYGGADARHTMRVHGSVNPSNWLLGQQVAVADRRGSSVDPGGNIDGYHYEGIAVRRVIARVMVMLTVVSATIAVAAGSASAFYRDPQCEQGVRTIYFHANNGKLLGYASWWQAATTVYNLEIYDADDSDGAPMGARVDSLNNGVIPYTDNVGGAFEYKIYYGVRKWRATWNGYASDWYTPTNC